VRLQTLCVLLISALTLAGCSTAIYKQASGPTSLGYSEAPLEDGRYRVTFRGRNFNTAYDFALLRAAEITLAKGHIWFRVTNSFSDEDQDHGHNSHVSIGSGYGHYGHRGRHWRNHWGNDWSVGFGFPIGSTYRNALHSIDIQMGDGTKPEGGEDDDRIYDAASVKATIGAQIGRTNPDN
jgi:hypothetical protein